MVITTGNSEGPFHLCILYPSNYASCALSIDSNLFLWRNWLVADWPKKYEHPLTSFATNLCGHDPFSSSTGSDQRMSQNSPTLGGSWNLCKFFRSLMVFSSGLIPPCKAKNLSLTRQEMGRASNVSMNNSYTSMSYLYRTSVLKLKNWVIYLHSWLPLSM